MKKLAKDFFTTIFLIFIIIACGGEEQSESTTGTVQQPKTSKEKVDSVSKEKTITESQVEVETEKSNNARLMNNKVEESYVVQDGETLGFIAKKIYGDSKKWFDIFALNESEIDNWNIIFPGQELKLPQHE